MKTIHQSKGRYLTRQYLTRYYITQETQVEHLGTIIQYKISKDGDEQNASEEHPDWNSTPSTEEQAYEYVHSVTELKKNKKIEKHNHTNTSIGNVEEGPPKVVTVSRMR